MPRPTWGLRDIHGNAIALSDPYFVYGGSGLGLPAAQHLAHANAYQDGEDFDDSLYEARTVQIGIDIMTDTPEEMPAARDALYRMLAPVRAGCYLTRTREDGTQREVLARLIGALDMPRQARQSGAHQRVVLTLRAAQPHWYDPVATLWVYATGATGVGTWYFPLAFPAGFGASAITVAETYEYLGHIDAYPVIQVTGPATGLVITNESLGTKLDLGTLGYAIAGGEVVTFDLRDGYKTVVSSVNGNIIAYLSDDSQLGTWRIGAHPEPEDGLNTVTVELAGATPNTEVVIRYNTLYGGV